MAPVVIVGAMIGAGIMGGMAMASDQPIWKGALIGAGLGALGGWGVGALGAGGAGASILGEGALAGTEASLGAASADALGMGVATAAESSLPSVAGSVAGGLASAGPATYGLGAFENAGFFTGSEWVKGGMQILNSGFTLVNALQNPVEYESTDPIAPATIDVAPTTPSFKPLTQAQIDSRNARMRNIQQTNQAAIQAKEKEDMLALLRLRESTTNPLAYKRAQTTAEQKRAGVLPGPGAFQI